MAKTYKEVNPEANIIIFDEGQTIGGVWATERLYPGLKTNNLVGTYEVSDFPMTYERFGVKPYQHIPGAVNHEYLRQYAEEFKISSAIRFNCKAGAATKVEKGGWLLTVSERGWHEQLARETQVLAAKLVVATGMTSDPFIPKFEGSADFKAPQFHVKEIGLRAESLYASRNVIVLGNSKSAWDSCYLSATRGAQVDCIIRSSGHGPGWVTSAYVTPFKIWLEKLVSLQVTSLQESAT